MIVFANSGVTMVSSGVTSPGDQPSSKASVAKRS
jgi:hypothetical protein